MRIITLLFLVTFCSSQAFSQASGNYENSRQNRNDYRYNQQSGQYQPTSIAQAAAPNSSVVNFDVKVLYNVEADSYMAIFHLSQVGKTVGQVDTLINERINGFKNKLAGLGIPEKNVFSDMLTFVPVYEYEVQRKLFSKKYNEIPKGFELKKNVHVLFEDENLLEKIVSAAAQNEIYDFVRVNYYVKNLDEIYKKMRTEAKKLIKEKEGDYRELGIELDTLYRSISENKMLIYPYSSYSTYQAYSSNNLLNTANINGKSKVVQAQKSTTQFYNPIDYSKFDVVVNPIILKPVVQFTYNLVVLYERNKPKQPNSNIRYKTVKEKQFYLIRPDGSLQLLDVK